MWFQIAEAAPSLAKEHLPAGCECRKVLKHLKLLFVCPSVRLLWRLLYVIVDSLALM